MLIKHKDEEVRQGENAQFLQDNATSVVSGRTMEEIADDRNKVWRSNHEHPVKTLPAKKPTFASFGLVNEPQTHLRTGSLASSKSCGGRGATSWCLCKVALDGTITFA